MSCLQVTVHAGRDLKQQGWFDKLDPYVTLKLGETSKTGAKHGDAGDRSLFGDTLTLDWDMETPLEIQVDDDDLINKDDHVGSVSVTADALRVPSWHGWLQINRKGERAGELLVTTVCMNDEA
eukprot:Gregarina_sp_Pseudo_9__3595@NODE_3756_length_565_cov_405_659696_g3439_i0_p1_GENE_NODE_3756_length_565_cov_405_659696_g3439_i0NODE_3756_length_565_cov_405_659696_g3439_i0_p1_ORF_typecomplete_len123_score13_78C2/PF00168_30/7_3e10_NODE_3756_length_565_cov_405_659696_g3439_i0119487